MEEQLQKVLKKAKKPISFEDIVSKMDIHTKEEEEQLRILLKNKLKDYSVIKTGKNNYALITKTSFKKGRFYGNRRGDGEVVVTTSYTDRDDKLVTLEERYPIDRGHTNGAIDGDVVLINSYLKDKKGNLAGSVEKIIERNLDAIMGEVYRMGDSYFVRPVDKKKANLTIALEGEAIEGQRVAISLQEQTNDNFYIGKIERTFDHKDDPDEDILWEAFKCGIDDQFSPESMEQVKYLPTSVSDLDKIGRMDLTEWEIFTIDGEDTKDIDDAISCKRLDNGNFLLGVHIADVTHYVPENSPLDKDAFRKGTSAYLAGKVIPMLPHELSNGICSLNPNVLRLGLSCIMEIDQEGNVLHRNVCESVIKSKMKMSYTEVNKILRSDIISPEYADYSDTLKEMNNLARLLRGKRIGEGALEFDRPELNVCLDDNGKVTGFSIRKQDLGENLIEEFMLIANETVDKLLCDIGAPCLHRVHDIPSEERLGKYLELLEAVGYPYDKYDVDDLCHYPKALQDLTEFVKNTGKISDMLSTNLVRCMSRAKYSPINIGHNGLAKENYCHFTAPIRRYPDMTIHRIVKDCWLNKENSARNRKKWELQLPEIAVHSSQMERAADEAEMQTLNMRCAEYMNKHMGEDFSGTIIGLSDNGIQVQLDNYIEGRVRLRNLVGDYVYNPDTYTLVSLDGRENYYIGDRLSLKVKDANKVTKTIDFKVNGKIDENKTINSNERNQYVKIKAKNNRDMKAYCNAK